MTEVTNNKSALDEMPSPKTQTSLAPEWYKKHYDTIRKALTPAKVDGDLSAALTCVQNYLEHDAKTGIVRTRIISVPRWVLEDLLQAATSQQATKTGCETCEGTGRLMVTPTSEHTHPCDDCQPEALKEFNRGMDCAESQQAREWTSAEMEEMLQRIAVVVEKKHGTTIMHDARGILRDELLALAAKGIIRVKS